MSTTTVQIWSEDDRNNWIKHAINSDLERENKNGYTYRMMMKLDEGTHTENEVEDPKRTFATTCLAKCIYGSHPLMKRLSLCFYKSLMMKIQSNSFLNLMYSKGNFIVLLKGSNAYNIVLRNVHLEENDEIEYSDLDIAVFINPYLHNDMFQQIHSSMVILMSQCLSRYKKDLDKCFGFISGHESNVDNILYQDLVTQFKEQYTSTLKSIPEFVSPFESNEMRNLCSKRSFMIIKSNVKENTVVSIDIPHLEKCHFIPLKKTPLVLSQNKTIEFNRDTNGLHKAKFELLRLRLNNVYQEEIVEDTDSDRERKNSIKKINVPADFIDISIPFQDDSELLEFWKSKGYNHCYEVFDRHVGTNIMIPDLNECIRELNNMIELYTSSQAKRAKREKRLNLFIRLRELRRTANIVPV